MRAFVLVNTDIGYEKELLETLRRVEGVSAAYEVYGVYDLVIELDADSYEKLKEIVFAEIRPLKHVRSSITMTSGSLK